jgi:exosortase J
MSDIPNPGICVPIMRPRRLSPVQFAALATTLAVLGLSTIWLTMIRLWMGWTTDALKSIGMVVPLVSLILILRVWKTLGWRTEGTWWGLALLSITAAVAMVQQQVFLVMAISPRWYTPMPPSSFMLFAYGSGVVLLLGGVRLYRAALFPILLLLLANPVPRVFSLLVDLPLQHASAHIARAFAVALGHSLTPDHLRLMFTPDFGMFIAPGCNGIRGSVAMGFIALIAGYVYRFRWTASALVIVGAILLGYVFNLARLCMLVLYYVVALHFTSLQSKGEIADYLIGAVLFLIATLLLFAVIHRLRDTGSWNLPEAAIVSEQGGFQDCTPRTRVAQLAAMTAIMLLGFTSLARAHVAIHPSTVSLADAAAERFPSRLGNYTRMRTWKDEISPAGPVAYFWAEYAPTNGGTPIAIGVSPILGWHDPLICHYIRGEAPLWRGQLTTATAGGGPSSFSSAFYNDGVTQYIEASTLCRGGTCGEYATQRTHFGFIYTRTNAESLLRDEPMDPIPVVLRVETLDTTIPADAARQQLTNDLRAFLASVKLDDLTRPYSR